jgi:hypothetical protein
MRNTNPTNSDLTLTSTIDELCLLQEIVEKLAQRRVDLGHGKEIVPPSCKAVETSSLEAYVSGNVLLSVGDEMMTIPYATCFLFTCSKQRGNGYRLSFCQSLS